ncbi:hypothetical protein [Segetibacter aerophilus]|uniref:Thymidylate kinase-like domain-containing protein n=1 Tax=Segetibacter aerophilus TaxID=670293 RepID=A0A512B892_9BACT|nr:hypothetical protein [Segetibacter aerophilus]GEO08176.1 hypothetical protein SAE01_06720 [Segetibacter aerophilus]
MNQTVNTLNSTTIISSSNLLVHKVPLIHTLITAFHSYEISYCHWKSNEHLDASMKADTDLDILFDEKQKDELEVLLMELGFKKFVSIRQKQYKDIEDFIGLDLHSGKVVHLHLHYKLTLGEPYLKSYQLDLHKKILESRVWDDEFGIYRSDPNTELILLYIREALKMRNRDMVKMYLKNKIYYSENLIREYNWLKRRCSSEDIKTILKGMFTNYLPVFFIVFGNFNRIETLKLSVIIKKEFRKNRQFLPLGALARRWYREICVKSYKKTSKFLNRPIMSHRINPRGGLIVGVVGADGSGKSTVTANLYNTFEKKLDVYKIYFGRGVGRVSLPRKILLGFKKFFVQNPSKKQLEKSAQSVADPRKGFIANVYKCLEALLVANEKRRNIALMQAARKKGMLVICDRFPQNQVMAYNDGPLLHHLSTSRNIILRAIAKKEASIYALAEANPPDLLFKLIANAEVVEARKPGEHSLETLEKKIAGFKNMEISGKCKVVSIDAARPLEEVLFIAKKEIWASYL